MKGNPMGRSFYYGKDAELYTGSQSFSTKITATPVAYGLTAPQATSYAATALTYKTEYLAAIDPETRTASKIIAKDDARAALVDATAQLAKIIEATPTVTNEQKNDLGLSVRATPTPMAPPGTANKIVATFAGDGSLNLTWKCENPKGSQGTIYQVWRHIDGEAEFTYLGGNGLKKFTDETLPAGSTAVTYQIQAVRSTAVGEWAQFNVNFGKSAGGGTFAKVTESPVKIAA
jgi:hypothetical protein